MIDTIKFKVPINEEQYKNIRSGERFLKIKRDGDREFIEFDIKNHDIYVGSYSRKITVKIKPNFIDIEFSVPKILFGHNVSLISNNSEIEEAVVRVFLAIKEVIPDVMNFREWGVTRLDLCWAWKFPSQEEAEKALGIVKTLKYKGFKEHDYKTAKMWVSDRYALKFYLKAPEFATHDFKALIDRKYDDKAMFVSELSQGVLRYEISMRNKLLVERYKKGLVFSDIMQMDLIEELKHYFYYLVKIEPMIMNLDDVMNLLLSKYKKTKAIQLYQFYRAYYSDVKKDRLFLQQSYDNSTIWRNLKDLQEAGVGIPSDDVEEYEFDLDIPSDNSVFITGDNAEASPVDTLENCEDLYTKKP